jgi:hypothetical protein
MNEGNTGFRGDHENRGDHDITKFIDKRQFSFKDINFKTWLNYNYIKFKRSLLPLRLEFS